MTGIAVAIGVIALIAGIARAQFKGTEQRPVSQRAFRTGGPDIKGQRLMAPVSQAAMATDLMMNYGGL